MRAKSNFFAPLAKFIYDKYSKANQNYGNYGVVT